MKEQIGYTLLIGVIPKDELLEKQFNKDDIAFLKQCRCYIPMRFLELNFQNGYSVYTVRNPIKELSSMKVVFSYANNRELESIKKFIEMANTFDPRRLELLYSIYSINTDEHTSYYVFCNNTIEIIDIKSDYIIINIEGYIYSSNVVDEMGKVILEKGALAMSEIAQEEFSDLYNETKN